MVPSVDKMIDPNLNALGSNPMQRRCKVVGPPSNLLIFTKCQVIGFEGFGKQEQDRQCDQ